MNKVLTIILIILLALTLFLGAIAVPILCRPFYYLEISHLDIVSDSGYDLETIKNAYNEMMDYCIGKTDVYSSGSLKFSEEGADHFADCKVLFLLDLRLLKLCVALLLLLFILKKTKLFSPVKFKGKKPCFYAGTGLLAAIAIVFGLCAINFDRAFYIFHTLFFPGKTNWYFNPKYDQIINILPEEFFMDCEILIASLIALGCAFFIYWGIRNERKEN